MSRGESGIRCHLSCIINRLFALAGPEKFYTPPSFSVPPAPEPMKLARQRPQKLRFSDRISTPNIAVMIRSPNISPIPATSIRSLDFDSPHLKPNNGGALKRGMGGGSGEIDRLMEASFNTTSFVSPMEKSFRCPLNDHLDLKLVLKDYDLAHLVPIFESKSVGGLVLGILPFWPR